MAELNLLPSTLNIDCVAGDDVVVEITITKGTGCNSSVIDITNLTFAAVLVAGSQSFSATVAKDVPTGKVTVTWSDSQTLSAGPGSWKWYFTVTDGTITRTRLSGSFTEVARA